MSSTSLRSSRSCIERSATISSAASVIGVSSRSFAHCSRENIRYGLYCCCSMRISIANAPALLSVALARRFFLEPRHRGPALERGLDLLKRHVPYFQQHQQMKQQIGGFGDQMLAIVADRRDNGFNRLLAELFGAMRRPLVEQLARIGALSARCGTDIDEGGEV